MRTVSPRVSFAACAALASLFAPHVPCQEHRLVYELPVDALQRSLRDDPGTGLEQCLAQCVEVVAARVGDGIRVVRHEATGFVVTVPADRTDELPRLRRRIEAAGTLEMRMVADAPFDLPAERARLLAWLAAGGRERVLADPRALDAFHADTEHGPLAHGKLRWHVHRTTPKADAPARWHTPYQQIPQLQPASVPLYDATQWNGGDVPAAAANGPAPCLVELVAVDLEQIGFSHRDLDLDHVVVTRGNFPGVRYRLRRDRIAAYHEWSRHNIGHCAAVIWNDEVVTAPRFESAIPGVGAIYGNLSVDEAEDIANALRAGALPVSPRLMQQDTAPPK
jgi:hypothetical protein